MRRCCVCRLRVYHKRCRSGGGCRHLRDVVAIIAGGNGAAAPAVGAGASAAARGNLARGGLASAHTCARGSRALAHGAHIHTCSARLRRHSRRHSHRRHHSLSTAFTADSATNADVGADANACFANENMDVLSEADLTGKEFDVDVGVDENGDMDNPLNVGGCGML